MKDVKRKILINIQVHVQIIYLRLDKKENNSSKINNFEANAWRYGY